MCNVVFLLNCMFFFDVREYDHIPRGEESEKNAMWKLILVLPDLGISNLPLQ